MNCCIILDCAQDNDLADAQHYRSSDITKFYERRCNPNGATLFMNPCCDVTSKEDNGKYYCQQLRDQSLGGSSLTESLTGAVETTYDEADQMEAEYEKIYVTNRSPNQTVPSNKSKLSFGDIEESGETLKSILTRRNSKMRITSQRMEDMSDSSYTYRELGVTSRSLAYRSQKEYPDDL
jgi:hypothetical protein